MNIEQKIFSKYVIDENKLKKYGFKIKNKKLIFETNISDGGFRVIIEYKEEITGKIFDLSTEEEYTNYRIESSSGFSSQIREEYIELLKDIRNKCSKKQIYKTKQAQNIYQYIIEKYKDEPEFLWEKFPSYAIFRNKKNNKWYALFGTVSLNKVDCNSASKEVVEIINVKVDKNKIDELLNIKGIYEAYHMNKKNWISIIFDETIKDSQIKNLVDKSVILSDS